MSATASPVLPALALVFNAFVWGVSWWPFRQLGQAGLHPLWATALIYALSVLAISAWRPGAWAELLRTPTLWVLVLAAGTTNAAFNWGVTVGDVVRVVLLFYLMPLWSVLLAWLLVHEPLRLGGALRVALALAGAAVVLWPEGGGWPVPRGAAEALGLLGGFSFALNNVMLRREARRSHSARALSMFVGGMAVSAGVALLAGVAPPPRPAPGWLAGAAALGVMFLLSNLALQYGAGRLRASATSVIMLTEVLFAAVSAIALGAGAMTGQLALGAGLIVSAALLSALRP